MTELETYIVRRIVMLRRILRKLGRRCWQTIRTVLDELRAAQRALKFFNWEFELA